MPRPSPKPLTPRYVGSVTYRRAGMREFGAGICVSALALLLVVAVPAYAETAGAGAAPGAAISPYSYADVAALADQAEAIAVVRARSFAKVVPPGASAAATQRYYVEAQVDALIRGEAGLPARIGFLIDVASGVNPARTLKGRPHLIFGKAGPRSGQFQLSSSASILPSSPAAEAQVRRIAAELVAPDAAPEITRIAEAFHVQGTVAGESETQVFLATRNGRPVSVSIVRRPSEEPRFGAALGEIVDEAAALPPPDTLLWYRLACSLPRALPSDATTKLTPDDAKAAAFDYDAFIAQLSPCTRSRRGSGAIAPAPPAAPLGNDEAPG